MSGSVREVQDLADQILALLGVRIRSGELVVRYRRRARAEARDADGFRTAPRAASPVIATDKPADATLARALGFRNARPEDD